MDTSPDSGPSSSHRRSHSHTAQDDRKNYLVGICLLLVVVFLWTSSNFVTQDLFDDGYEKPFLITYLNTSSFSLYLLPFLLRKGLKLLRDDGKAPSRGSNQQQYQPLPTETQAAESLNPYTPDQDSLPEEELPPFTIRETAKLAGWFCLLWFIANWLLNVGLGYTSVASATILSSVSGFFTLAMGRLLRIETLTLVKILAVMTSFGGVILVSLADSSPGSQGKDGALGTASIVGDILALLSAFFYALYVILLKVRVRSESRMDMQLFFGFVGLFNILFLWPIGLLLHLTRIEIFELPTSSRVMVAILINMSITLSSDYIYVLAMLKTTPLVVTVGLSLTMPLAVVGDFFLHKPVKFQVILGACIVLLSFVAVGIEDSRKGETDLISGKPLDEESTHVRLEEEVDLVTP